MRAAAAAAAAAATTVTSGASASPTSLADARVSSPYTRCGGESGRVPADVWREVREVQRTDYVAHELGIGLDPRSDSLESLRHVLEDQVLPDLEAAILDCIFGVVSLLTLTLHLVEASDGVERARELFNLAGRLMFQSADLLEDSGWLIDAGAYHTYQLLLGMEPTDCAGAKLRIFIYDSTRDLTHSRLRTSLGMMAAATHVHAYLERASCVTSNPEEADLFFIPAYHGDQYTEFLETRIHGSEASGQFPYLARRRGVDHVFVVGANLPSWPEVEPLRNAVMLSVESYQVNDGIPRWYSPWKDVMIPGYIDRWRIAGMRKANRPTHERGFILAFHGNHPGTHHLYVKHGATVRTRILESFSGISDCSVGSHVPDFFERMGRSHFCLVPRGSSAWTIHLYESFFFGCIPVLLSDKLEVPFQELVNWPALSLKWPEDRVGPELLTHLRSIPLGEVAAMKGRLEEAACFFDYHRGWGVAPSDGGQGWTKRGEAMVVLARDCPYAGHGDTSSAGACRKSCEEHASCNVVNYRPPIKAAIIDDLADGGDCVLRACSDPAQPTLTGGAEGYEVWARLGEAAHACSPYAGMFRDLEERVRRRPFTSGPHWQ